MCSVEVTSVPHILIFILVIFSFPISLFFSERDVRETLHFISLFLVDARHPLGFFSPGYRKVVGAVQCSAGWDEDGAMMKGNETKKATDQKKKKNHKKASTSTQLFCILRFFFPTFLDAPISIPL